MCPDPTLLAAYLDGTLFSRDAGVVDRHTPTCARCAAILATMRQAREATRPSTWSRPWTIFAAATGVAIVGIGSWAVSGSEGAHREVALPARVETARLAAVVHAAAVPVTPDESDASLARPAEQPAQQADSRVGERPRSPAAGRTESKPQARPSGAGLVVNDDAPPAIAAAPAVDTVADRDQADTGVTLRGGRAHRPVLRARDLVVERSTDGGATWAAEHTSDRSVLAGAFVDANVAWLVGESGLVLRRTTHGWFGASPPGDGHIVAVRASSPSKATVTLEDGRVFSTANGGVTWSAP